MRKNGRRRVVAKYSVRIYRSRENSVVCEQPFNEESKANNNVWIYVIVCALLYVYICIRY